MQRCWSVWRTCAGLAGVETSQRKRWASPPPGTNRSRKRRPPPEPPVRSRGWFSGLVPSSRSAGPTKVRRRDRSALARSSVRGSVTASPRSVWRRDMLPEGLARSDRAHGGGAQARGRAWRRGSPRTAQRARRPSSTSALPPGTRRRTPRLVWRSHPEGRQGVGMPGRGPSRSR